MQLDASFDLIEISRLLWSRKTKLLLCGLIVAVLAFAISLSLTRRYASAGSLVVRSEALTAPETEVAFYSAGINEAVVTTEQEVLTSDGLLRRLAATLTLPPALIDPPSLTQRFAGLLEGAAGLVGGPSLRQRLETSLDAIAPAIPLTARDEEDARTRFLASTISITAAKNSSVITVLAVTPDPQLSADISNGVMSLYMQDRLAEQGHTAKNIEDALRERLRQVRLQIAGGQDRLVKLLKAPGAIETNEVPGLMRDLTLLGAQYTQAQADLARRKAEYESAVRMRERGGAAGAPDSLTTVVNGDLRRQLATLQQESAKLASDYLPDAPARRAVQQQINAVQSAIASETTRGIEQRRTELAAAQATADSLQQQVESLRQRRQSQSSSGIDVDREKQAVDSLWKISDALETRLIDLAARPVNPNARVLSPALPPSRPSFPNKTLFIIAGFLVGTVGAAGVMLLTNHMRRLRPLAIQLAEQLHAPLLGGLPAVADSVTGQRRLLRSAIRTDAGDGLAATLRAVALELEDAVLEGKIGCLTVTSAKAGEGKTTVAIAIGRSLAAMSIRVLLVDLDLRHPSTEQAFRSSAADSLEAVEQRIGPNTVLRIKSDRLSGLHVLSPVPAGVSDPIAYLRSPALREMVNLARGSYDLILFDTPPVMAVPDALEVARLSDGILLVSELGRSDEPERAELSRRLTRTRKPLCGIVVTKVEQADMQSGAYSGYTRIGGGGHREPAANARDVSFEQASPP